MLYKSDSNLMLQVIFWQSGYGHITILLDHHAICLEDHSQQTPGPVFTKILILRISLILIIFLRIVVFLRKIPRIRIFLFTKILILRITLMLRIFLRMVFILRIFLRIRIFYSQIFLFLD